MKVGMLTGPFGRETLETVMDFAQEAGIPCLEVGAGPGSNHIDPANLSAARIRAIRDGLAARGLAISGLAYYTNTTDPARQRDVQAHAIKAIDAAAKLGAPTVCMLAGLPVEGMSKIDTIRKVVPKAFKPILAHARKRGITIALEN
ncbi:MAG: hypothetical protein QG656_1347, partial [Candidatus Hydrogenedentes bacterium]|nr:hypothetical protein [Candidatus Hydrogenedentota bacterium]